MATVILTDETGTALGIEDILKAHSGAGKLHRAFSVYIFRNTAAAGVHEPRLQELLIQRRSAGKMLWPLFWANTCCSHPKEDEDAIAAGTRRLKEEMGFICPLEEKSSYVYRAEDPEGRGVEHEYVTVLTGNGDEISVAANRDEVAEWQWVNVQELLHDFQTHPELYAPWLELGLKEILEPAR